MKQFYLDAGRGFSRFEHQIRENKKEPCDCEYACDGCLLDNFLLYGKRGLYLFQEHFTSCWSSDYLVTFAPYDDDDACEEIWFHFYDLRRLQDDDE